MSPTQKVWLVTGTSSGFGYHLVKVILSRGDLVIATARSLSAIKHFDSPQCKTMELDVTSDADTLRQKAEEAVAAFGKVDVLVNNAGFAGLGVSEEVGVSGYQRQFAANFFGVIGLTTALLPHMRAATSGCIAIIGSRHAWKTQHPMTGPYAASKAAIHAYGEVLASEVAPFNIRVLLVQPGAHRTDGLTNTAKANLNEREFSDYDALRQRGRDRLAEQNGKQPGDALKAANIIVDVVRGEGVAEGKPLPLWLLLGKDAEDDLEQRVTERLKNLAEWQDVTRSTAVEDSNVVLI